MKLTFVLVRPLQLIISYQMLLCVDQPLIRAGQVVKIKTNRWNLSGGGGAGAGGWWVQLETV